MNDEDAARPAPGTELAALNAIPDPGAICLDFAVGEARWSMLLTRRGDQVRGFVNRCPHARWPLERPDGRVVVQDGRLIVCAAHFASFDLDTGAHAGGPGTGAGLMPVPVLLANGVVRIGP